MNALRTCTARSEPLSTAKTVDTTVFTFSQNKHIFEQFRATQSPLTRRKLSYKDSNPTNSIKDSHSTKDMRVILLLGHKS